MYGGEERRGEEASFKEHFLARQIALLQSKAPNNLRLVPKGKQLVEKTMKKNLFIELETVYVVSYSDWRMN